MCAMILRVLNFPFLCRNLHKYPVVENDSFHFISRATYRASASILKDHLCVPVLCVAQNMICQFSKKRTHESRFSVSKGFHSCAHGSNVCCELQTKLHSRVTSGHFLRWKLQFDRHEVWYLDDLTLWLQVSSVHHHTCWLASSVQRQPTWNLHGHRLDLDLRAHQTLTTERDRIPAITPLLFARRELENAFRHHVGKISVGPLSPKGPHSWLWTERCKHNFTLHKLKCCLERSCTSAVSPSKHNGRALWSRPRAIQSQQA